MTYKTLVIDHELKTKKLAAEIENKANEMAKDGWEFVAFSTVTSGKAILVFRTQNEIPKETKEPEKAKKNKKAVEAEAAGEKE